MWTNYSHPAPAGSMYSKQCSVNVSQLSFFCLFPPNATSLSLSGKKNNFNCNCSFALVSMKNRFSNVSRSYTTFPFSFFPALLPRSNLNWNVVTAMLVIPLIMWWNGKTQKHLLRFQSGKSWFSRPDYNNGKTWFTFIFLLQIYAKIIESFLNQYNHLGLNSLAQYHESINSQSLWIMHF